MDIESKGCFARSLLGNFLGDAVGRAGDAFHHVVLGGLCFWGGRRSYAKLHRILAGEGTMTQLRAIAENPLKQEVEA